MTIELHFMTGRMARETYKLRDNAGINLKFVIIPTSLIEAVVFDRLFDDLAKARVHGGVIPIGGECVEHATSTELFFIALDIAGILFADAWSSRCSDFSCMSELNL
jgi:hypothetical protein